MKITLIAVGKLKERWWREAAEEYLKRLRPYADVNVVEVPDRDVTADEARAMAEEGAGVLKAIPKSSHVIVLDIEGKQLDSRGLSAELDRLALEGRSSVTFVIGGAAGLAQDVRKAADAKLSLGRMTLPHQLARVVLLEQVYRAFKISRGEPYHR